MVKKSLPVVIWNTRVSVYFKKAYQYIKEDSFSNAEKFKEGIVKIIESLPRNPEKYPPDRFKSITAANTGLLKNIHFGLLIPTTQQRSESCA